MKKKRNSKWKRVFTEKWWKEHFAARWLDDAACGKWENLFSTFNATVCLDSSRRGKRHRQNTHTTRRFLWSNNKTEQHLDKLKNDFSNCARLRADPQSECTYSNATQLLVLLLNIQLIHGNGFKQWLAKVQNATCFFALSNGQTRCSLWMRHCRLADLHRRHNQHQRTLVHSWTVSLVILFSLCFWIESAP